MVNPKEIMKLKKGNKIKINGRTFKIKDKEFHKAQDKFDQDVTRFELGNNFVLEFTGDSPAFFQIIEKKGWFGFTSGRSKYEDIKKIQII